MRSGVRPRAEGAVGAEHRVGGGDVRGDGEQDGGRDAGAAHHEVDQGLGACPVDPLAHPVGDELPGAGVDRGPGAGGVLGGEGALPRVHPGLVDPAPQGALLAGPRGAPAQQVGADPGQDLSAAAPQPRPGERGQVRAEGGDDRVGDLGGCLLELERDHPGPVRVEGARAHRVVQATEPGARGRPSRSVGGAPNRVAHPPFGVHAGDVERERHDRGGVEGHVPRRLVDGPDGAVLGFDDLDRGQGDDRLVLHRARRVHDLLARPHDLAPRVEVTTGRARPGQRRQPSGDAIEDGEQLGCTGRPRCRDRRVHAPPPLQRFYSRDRSGTSVRSDECVYLAAEFGP